MIKRYVLAKEKDYLDLGDNEGMGMTFHLDAFEPVKHFLEKYGTLEKKEILVLDLKNKRAIEKFERELSDLWNELRKGNIPV
jgi:hypothetical protein